MPDFRRRFDDAPMSGYSVRDMLAHPVRWLIDPRRRWTFMYAVLMTLLALTNGTMLVALLIGQTTQPSPFVYVSASMERATVCAGDTLIIHLTTQVKDVPRVIGAVDTIWSERAQATVQSDVEMAFVVFTREGENHPTHRVVVNKTLPPGRYEWRTGGTDFESRTAVYSLPFDIVACP